MWSHKFIVIVIVQNVFQHLSGLNFERVTQKKILKDLYYRQRGKPCNKLCKEENYINVIKILLKSFIMYGSEEDITMFKAR